ncbi:hypothetical protein AWV80_41145 [Cupriavidus sp. UYMU48A]|nr:hypothetical protein AWV80_41145 [Cupriavidus sp. UYMU48A]
MTSASKAFNLTGLKHSLLITENPALRKACRAGQGRNNMYYGGSTFGQIATEVAFRECDEWSDQLMQYVEGNFDFARNAIEVTLPEAVCYRPQSTYFLWLDLTAYGLQPEALLAHFEERVQIMVTSGHSLGTGGSGHIRLNLGCPRSVLAQGLERIAAAGLPL